MVMNIILGFAVVEKIQSANMYIRVCAGSPIGNFFVILLIYFKNVTVFN